MIQRTLILLSVFFPFVLTTQAQVVEDFKSMALGNQNALIIEIPDATSKYVEREWKQFMKTYGKVKNVRKADEKIVEDAQVLHIGGAQLVDLYSRVEKSAGGSKMILWIDMNGQFISSDSAPDAYDSSVELLEDFAHHVKIEMIAAEFEDQVRELEKLESKMKKLQKANDKYHEQIEDAKERIAKAEADIEQNIQDQELTAQEIGTQSAVVEEVRKRLDAARAERSGGGRQ